MDKKKMLRTILLVLLGIAFLGVYYYEIGRASCRERV